MCVLPPFTEQTTANLGDDDSVVRLGADNQNIGVVPDIVFYYLSHNQSPLPE